MNMPPKIDMAEATRLTREGRLGEAMAVLRRALPGLTARFSDIARPNEPGPTAVSALLPPKTTGTPSAPETSSLASVTPSRLEEQARSPSMLRRALERI